VSRCPDSTPTILAIFGDPVVGQALALLLRGFRYDALLLPASSSSDLKLPEYARLLLVTPTPQLDSEQREAFLSLLEDKANAARIPLLKLVNFSEEPGDGDARTKLKHTVSWPCGIEELKRQIEGALLANSQRSNHLLSLRTQRDRGGWDN
jgi:uncharacterized integral membrane protein